MRGNFHRKLGLIKSKEARRYETRRDKRREERTRTRRRKERKREQKEKRKQKRKASERCVPGTSDGRQGTSVIASVNFSFSCQYLTVDTRSTRHDTANNNS